MKLVKGQAYHVRWHDTVAVEHWCDIESIKAHAKKCAKSHNTIGYYVCEQSDFYIFSSTLNTVEGMLPYANVTFIPKGVIKKVTSL